MSSSTLSRAAAVAGRNATTARHLRYWSVVLSGFFEPLLYMLAIGIGVGALVGDMRLVNGHTVAYAVFVAPAMLATLSMQAALAESQNFFVKMRYMRLYDAALATPVTAVDIALGELAWAMLRCALSSVAFLFIMVWLDLTTPAWALAAFAASVAVGFAFGAGGMLLATLLRGTQDFDYLTVTQVALFLFSGTFWPVESYPVAGRLAVECTPLYHGVELVRAMTTGTVGAATAWHAAYLLIFTVFGLTVARRRMRTALRR
jgi:lipooligosaccharide transport system permease protein